MADMYDKIDAALGVRGMSRRQLAIKAGIPVNTLSAAYSRRSKNFSPVYIKKIAEILELNWVELVYDTHMDDDDREILRNLPTFREYAELSQEVETLSELVKRGGYGISQIEGEDRYQIVTSSGFFTVDKETVEKITRDVSETAVLYFKLLEQEEHKELMKHMAAKSKKG